MKQFIHALLFSFLLAAVAITFFFSPYGAAIEENLGLRVLFNLRGAQPPPDQAVIINIDSETSKQLGLPEKFLKWPRSIHAELVKKLINYKARVIVFDIHFSDKKDLQADTYFAETVRKAGNVILIEQIKRQSHTAENREPTEHLEVDILEPPFSPLAESALALAPFPVPKIPVRVNQAWIFKTSAGDIPTLPAVALQATTLDQYSELYALISSARMEASGSIPSTSRKIIANPGRLVETMFTLRNLFKQEYLSETITAKMAADSDSQIPAELEATVKMYRGRNSIYINLYGPPATIPTFTFYDILSPDAETAETMSSTIKGKTVFVGASNRSWAEQKDGFYTVFSQPNGLDISGVELAATVFCNLLEDSHIKPVSSLTSATLILICSLFVCFCCFFFPVILATGTTLIFCACYLAITYSIFSRCMIWLPLIIPILVQPPLSFLSVVLYKYGEARHDRKQIKKALALYLPDMVVTELAKDLSYIKTGDKVLYSTCLMTDAENYTTLSEKLSPKQLSVLMNEYYHCIFSTIKERNGLVCNMIGDSILALWPSQEPQTALRENGCQAALQILSAVNQFNREHPGTMLPTRVGLHSGYLLMGNIGSDEHFEYAPVGDIVNTNSRIEGLNKQLGTRVLVSKETIQGLSSLFTREMGDFLLAGKTKPVTIYELISPDKMSSDEHQLYFEIFPQAIEQFKKGLWNEAIDLFQECVTLNEHDGPTQFFLNLCYSYQHNPLSDGWKGVIKVSK